jgi:hypothetical protein
VDALFQTSKKGIKHMAAKTAHDQARDLKKKGLKLMAAKAKALGLTKKVGFAIGLLYAWEATGIRDCQTVDSGGHKNSQIPPLAYVNGEVYPKLHSKYEGDAGCFVKSETGQIGFWLFLAVSGGTRDENRQVMRAAEDYLFNQKIVVPRE